MTQVINNIEASLPNHLIAALRERCKELCLGRSIEIFDAHQNFVLHNDLLEIAMQSLGFEIETGVEVFGRKDLVPILYKVTGIRYAAPLLVRQFGGTYIGLGYLVDGTTGCLDLSKQEAADRNRFFEDIINGLDGDLISIPNSLMLCDADTRTAGISFFYDDTDPEGTDEDFEAIIANERETLLEGLPEFVTANYEAVDGLINWDITFPTNLAIGYYDLVDQIIANIRKVKE